jgi:hypothetical protein
MTSLVNLEDFLDPGHDLVGGGVRWLVKVDNTIGFQHVDGAVCGRIAARQGGEMRRLDIELVKVLRTQAGLKSFN